MTPQQFGITLNRPLADFLTSLAARTANRNPMLGPLPERGLACADVRARTNFSYHAGAYILCLAFGLAFWQRVKLDFTLAGFWVAHRQDCVPVALTAFANVPLHDCFRLSIAPARRRWNASRLAA